MKPEEKKTAILQQLNQEKNPISLFDLTQKLGKDFKERSLRRWLNEMIEEGLLIKSGQKKATRYQIKQSLEVETNHCFNPESIQVIEKIKRPLFERNPISYNDVWFESYQPNETFYFPLNLRMQLLSAGQRSKREEPAGTFAHKIFNRLLIDLSYNSSRLEGNTYSLLDTQKLLFEGASAEGKLDEEKIMILNHKDAIRYMVDNAAKLEITEQTIYTLHYLLSDGLLEVPYTGKIRDHGVLIGGSTYLPFEEKRQLENRMKKILNKAAAIENPYEQSLFLLTHISYLQAFADVNKRTARLCANIPLIKNNLVPLSFNDIEKEDYISAMIAIYELQDIRPLVDLYAFSYRRTSVMYDSTLKAIGFDEIRVRYRQQRRTIIRDVIVNQITGNSLKQYVNAHPTSLINEEERPSFLEDVFEDLKEIDLSRIAGLGITPDQLESWLKKKNQI